MAHNKYDISMKEIVEELPDAWLELACCDPRSTVEVVNSEISTLEVRSDKVLRVRDIDGSSWLLNLEFQADHDLLLPYNVLYKSTALGKKHKLLVRSLVVLLRRKALASNLTGHYTLHFDNEEPYLEFRYHLIRL